MKINFQHTTFILFALATSFISFSQKKDENIGTEVVNVVKPYTPTISDAFKVKETPNLDDEDNAKKQNIKYNIFSFPVASTFTPSKGRAAVVDKTEQERLYNNYFTFGFGSYATANAELFVTENLSDNEYLGAMLRHQSSQGGIKGVELDDKFYDTSLDLTYGNKQRDLAWNLDLGYQNQVYNWYGLPENFGSSLNPLDRQNLINSIDPQHMFHNFYTGARIDFKESVFSKIDLNFNRFSDANGSAENKFYLKPTFKFKFNESVIKTNFSLDYISSSFNEYYKANNTDPNAAPFKNENAYVSFSINPNYQLLQDDLTLNLGADIVYLSTIKSVNNAFDAGSNNTLLFYPKITASYKVVGDLMIAYAGAEGGLHQNSYRELTNQNPFLSPTLTILPTDAQYDIYFGLKGKLANSVGYNIRGSYLSEKNKALFKANNYDENATNEDYEFGNSFNVVYDNMKTIGFFGELKADFSKTVAFGVNGTFNSFDNQFEQEAWNLPEIKLGSSLDVAISKKWFAGANVFFVGERKDFQNNTDIITNASPIVLDSYFDANFNLGYQHNERLTAFLRANNIANQAYQKWLNYPVQQFQLIIGASYKFDF